jgi:uncharacterized protein (UPF0335 family)
VQAKTAAFNSSSSSAAADRHLREHQEKLEKLEREKVMVMH